jgi:rubrerythrin
MLAEQLCQDHVVRVDVAEFHVCHVCNADAARTAATSGGVDLGGVAHGLHDLGRCPVCGASPHPRRTYRAARKNWLIVPAEWGGRHEHVHRHRCGCCGNLFAVNHDRCPLCRHQVPPRHRLTSVWVRRVGLDVWRSNARGEARRS